MPAVSRRQQRYLFANFGEAWVKAHHFDRLASEAEQRQHMTAAEKKRHKESHGGKRR